MNIRVFRPADAEAVRRIFVQGILDFATPAGLADLAAPYLQQSLKDDLADIPAHYLSRQDDCFWVAEIKGQVGGMLGVQRKSVEMAELRRMSVDSRFRRLGIGALLLDTAEEFCRKRGCQKVRLTTTTMLTAAIALYESRGYQVAGEQPLGPTTLRHYVKELTGEA